MGKSKELFMQIEDFEREGEKDQLYLQELMAEADLIPRSENEATIIVKPSKVKPHDKGPIEIDYSLPF